MTPKYIKTNPDKDFSKGEFRITLVGTTVYLYLNGEVATPFMKRNNSDITSAQNTFWRIKRAIITTITKKSWWNILIERIQQT